MMRIIASTLLLAALFLVPTQSYADPVDIEFVSPEMQPPKGGHGKGKHKGKHKKDHATSLPTLQNYDGWPLTIRLVMNDELGITKNEGIAPFFPIRGETGFIVFSDPDGCLAMDSPNFDSICYANPSDPDDFTIIPSDETYVEFTPDVDDVGLLDEVGHPGLRASLVDTYSAGLTGFNAFMGAASSVYRKILDDDGVFIGDEEIVYDGYGKGANDDLPGLVLVARHGMGVVWTDDYKVKQPLELVNIGGYVNTVSYSLNDPRNHTFIMAQMVVPGSLFAPAAFFDTCYTGGAPIADDESNCELWWSVEGADPVPVPNVGLGVQYAPKDDYREVFDATDFTVSAFVVSGVGPDRVVDMNGDGEIEDVDLELMGYVVLGSKRSVTFNQVSGDECFGPAMESLVFADLDNNGVTGIKSVCGPTSGSLSKPPR